MKLTDLWRGSKKPTVSFEVFPPHTDKGALKLEKVVDKIAALRPDFVSATIGAGGAARERSRQLVEKLARQKKLEVLAYFAGVGVGPDDILSALRNLEVLGVENVVAVRGNPPHEAPDFVPHPDAFDHASDLLPFIGSNFDFCLGCVGYPEGHFAAESRARDLDFLELKVANGAEFVITNYTYDDQAYFDFQRQVRERGLEIPLLPSVMPTYSVPMMDKLARISGVAIPHDLRRRLEALPEGDKKAVHDFGVDLAVNQCRALVQGGAPGIHLYTMNRAKSVVEIITRLRDEGTL